MAKAFAPATITNFFSVHQDKSRGGLVRSGATGGGYILSKGVVSRVELVGNSAHPIFETSVNGDSRYHARTTRQALRLLMKAAGKNARLRVEQQVDVPIGFGFGASAASALSAVLAASAALDLRLSKAQTAKFAHDAEIIQRTGLGTVSAVYDGLGAGLVYEPGAPGVAKFRNVRTSASIRIVTASLAPLRLAGLLSSQRKVARVNRFGDDALRRVLAEPTLDRMAKEGETFTRKVGLINNEVASLIRLAKRTGAAYASQNMVGEAMHAVVPLGSAASVARALRSSSLEPRVDVFELGRVKAGVISLASG
ncbi:MAG: hypothetical protein JRM80_12985 [Nitrososphaerota archaeon]|nr:hypothetical protein [Nitrososphaerota archaeon]